MSNLKQPVVSHFSPPHVSVKGYVNGFITCLVLTIVAYATAVNGSLDRRWAIGVIALLATVQCYVQLRRFLHLGDEFKPRWKLIVFLAMLSIVGIVVIGSLWIMNNLNYRMVHAPSQLNEYVESQDGL